MYLNLNSVISFLGNYAGRSKSEWIQKAVAWAADGNHASNVRECCYNAAKAALGNNASWADIESFAQSLIKSILH